MQRNILFYVLLIYSWNIYGSESSCDGLSAETAQGEKAKQNTEEIETVDSQPKEIFGEEQEYPIQVINAETQEPLSDDEYAEELREQIRGELQNITDITDAIVEIDFKNHEVWLSYHISDGSGGGEFLGVPKH